MSRASTIHLEDREWVNGRGTIPHSTLPSPISLPFTVNGHLRAPKHQSTLNQQLRGESNFRDSSGPLFSMYSKMAEEEDNKMADHWQKDADGILIFVSPHAWFRVIIRLD